METNENIRQRKTNSHQNEVISNKINNNTNNREKTKESDFQRSFNESYSLVNPEKSSYHLTRIILLRFLAFIYGLYSIYLCLVEVYYKKYFF